MGAEADSSCYGEEPWLANVFRLEERMHGCAFLPLRKKWMVSFGESEDQSWGSKWAPGEWTNEELQRILELHPSVLTARDLAGCAH